MFNITREYIYFKIKLLNGVAEMNPGDVKDHSIDAFGDAYEYLMTMYASNA